jgi:hypothetical protein
MPLNDAKSFVNSQQNDYLHEFKNDDKGYYLELTKDKLIMRIPKNKNEYLKIN